MTRLVVMYWGLPGTGKSYNALSFPKPLFFHDFDLNSEHLVKQLKEAKHYQYAPFRPMMTPDESNKVLESFYANIESDYKSADKGTIVVDTLSSFLQLLNKVSLDRIEQKRGFLIDKDKGTFRLDSKGQRIPNPAFEVYPFDYAERNEILKNVVNMGKGKPNVHIVVVAQAKEIYDARGRPTGNFEPQVPDATPYLVQVNIHTLLTEGVHMGTVDKWSFNMVRVGEVLDDPTYAGISKLVAKDVA